MIAILGAVLVAAAAIMVPTAAYATTDMQDDSQVAPSPEVSSDSEEDAQKGEQDAGDEGLDENESSDVAEAPSQSLMAVAADVRTISGTIFFDEQITLEQRQSVYVAATSVSDDSDVDGVPVPTDQISYDPESGVFSITELEPGKYKVLASLVDEVSGWTFYPGTSKGGNWDSPATGTPTGTEIDVTEKDRTDLEFFYEPALGGISISGWNIDMGSVIVTNIGTGEEASFVPRSGGAAADGHFSLHDRTLTSGVMVALRMATGGVTVYYDGSESGTLDPAEATILTIPVMAGVNIQMDLRAHTPGEEPNPSWLTDENRGELTAPESVPAGSTLRVFVGVNYAGQTLHGWMFSEATSLGKAVVSDDGYISLRIPAELRDDHRLVVSYASGWPVGWTEINVTASQNGAGDATKADSAAGAAVGVLANTGASSAPIAAGVLAGALLIAGTALVLSNQRRVSKQV